MIEGVQEARVGPVDLVNQLRAVPGGRDVMKKKKKKRAAISLPSKNTMTDKDKGPSTTAGLEPI